MDEKLKQCLKMMQYLEHMSYKFQYDCGNQGDLPKECNVRRDFHYFTLNQNGTVDYYGYNSGGDIYNSKILEVRHKALIPTEPIINLAWARLKTTCRTKAQGLVMQRLITHQLKFDDLDFLIEK